jgi:hypothetical protein
MAKRNDELLASELAALEKHLGVLETEICAADLRLAEIEFEQREILRRRARAEVWLRSTMVDIETLRGGPQE